jgi:MFS family permease
VGAQWLFVHDPNAATIVTLVQTASTLPMMLLALPAGVLADAFDRRWLLFGVQTYFIVVAVLLAVLTAAGMMPPALLLAFTLAIGAGQAVLSPTWQALITELVPRNELAAATRLDMVSSATGGPGVTKNAAHRARGSIRDRAATTAQSAGSRSGRCTCRRSTAT